jgi:hypothetical protein
VAVACIGGVVNVGSSMRAAPRSPGGHHLFEARFKEEDDLNLPTADRVEMDKEKAFLMC